MIPVKMRKEMITAKIDPLDDPKVKPEYIKDITKIIEFVEQHPSTK